MNNLTTRKIVLGMLMAFVLAFSVQGIADALIFGTTRTGDLSRVQGGGQFTLTFSLSPNQITAVDQDGNPIYTFNNTYYSRINGKYFGVSLSSPRLQNQKAPVPATETGTVPEGVSPVLVYDYDDEKINIDVSSLSGGSVQITRGGVSYPISGNSNELSERVRSGATQLTRSITLTGTAPTTEDKYVVTISDETPAEDLPGGNAANQARNLSFTIYVVNSNLDVRLTTIVIANPVQYGDNSDDLPITGLTFAGSGQTSNVPITYTVSGGGNVYVKEDYTGNKASPSSQSSLSSSLDTSSDANVYLRMNGKTNRVTVRVPGSNPPAMATYIYGWSTLTKVSGDDPPLQRGLTGSQLESPFIVEVKDANSQSVSGVDVTFSPQISLKKDPDFPTNLYGVNEQAR